MSKKRAPLRDAAKNFSVAKNVPHIVLPGTLGGFFLSGPQLNYLVGQTKWWGLAPLSVGAMTILAEAVVDIAKRSVTFAEAKKQLPAEQKRLRNLNEGIGRMRQHVPEERGESSKRQDHIAMLKLLEQRREQCQQGISQLRSDANGAKFGLFLTGKLTALFEVPAIVACLGSMIDPKDGGFSRYNGIQFPIAVAGGVPADGIAIVDAIYTLVTANKNENVAGARQAKAQLINSCLCLVTSIGGAASIGTGLNLPNFNALRAALAFYTVRACLKIGGFAEAAIEEIITRVEDCCSAARSQAKRGDYEQIDGDADKKISPEEYNSAPVL